MTYRETLSWLYSQLPMYQRIGAAAYKADLRNTVELCELLGNPQHEFRSIHVAGTNGKGSVCHLLASILQEHGLKTGLYTSPHLKDFRERIRVNGLMIPKYKVTSFIQRYRNDFQRIQPSFFEMTVGLAFDHFRQEQVDIAVVEVGMGGRLDSTNIITPLVSVVTNISYDHTHFLGDTLEKIALEKAGVIKPGIPVVIGETHPKTREVFLSAASNCHSHIIFADQAHVPEGISDSGPKMPLKGLYQRKNLLTVFATIGILRQLNFPIQDQTVSKGLQHVIRNTRLQGRWQIIGEHPLTICDTGHNEAGIREVVDQLRQTPYRNLHIVMGTVNDKDISSILRLLPTEARYYFCKAGIPRAMDAVQLAELAKAYGLHGKAYSSVRRAFAAAKRAAAPDDLIFIGGSTFVVAEVL